MARQKGIGTRRAAGNGGETRLSRAAVGRFSLYLRHLEPFEREGVDTVSSRRLAQELGLTDAQVRKDIAFLGSLGHRGVGYQPRPATVRKEAEGPADEHHDPVLEPHQVPQMHDQPGDPRKGQPGSFVESRA